MLTDVPGMLSRAGIYPHGQPTAVLHDKSVSRIDVDVDVDAVLLLPIFGVATLAVDFYRVSLRY